jgi:hypothetical protein
MTVTQEIARTHIANLVNDVHDIPTELVFNIDEVGSQEWADRKPRRVVIPHQERPRRIQCSVLNHKKASVASRNFQSRTIRECHSSSFTGRR